MRNRFERDRDFEFDMRERYGQGILSQGGTTSNQTQINRVDPAQALWAVLWVVLASRTSISLTA